MNLAKMENELLEQAIQAFQNETGLQLDVIQQQAEINGLRVDAIIKAPHHAVKFAVEVKRWAQQANLGALAEQVKRLPMEGVLVADYVNSNMGKKLKTMGVQYLDTAGNAYINQPPVFIHVTGNTQRDAQIAPKKETNRAFEATGLKVLYGFLCNPSLIRATYREIAKSTDVALGSVGWVVNSLKDAGFVIDRGRGGGRRLVNLRKMLDRWVEAYPEKLKPKHHVGEFIADDPNWWKDIRLEKYGAYWGGELAAAKYTHYLKPQTITIYIPEEKRKEFLARGRLRKAVKWTTDGLGIVSVYRPFWPKQKQNQKNSKAEAGRGVGLVNPILVYADLIASGDSRNLETARIIYERFIAEHIGED